MMVEMAKGRDTSKVMSILLVLGVDTWKHGLSQMKLSLCHYPHDLKCKLIYYEFRINATNNKCYIGDNIILALDLYSFLL